jgi:phospholipid/cholesterol/gamma-HCH transport system ATP-binding protein
MLFQFGALFTDLSVFDNVAFRCASTPTCPRPLIRDIVLMKLNAVGLRGAAALRISEVSGGMARRVALARAIALDPELDHVRRALRRPGPHLDGRGGQAHPHAQRRDLGATSLVVSHDVPESHGHQRPRRPHGHGRRIVAQGHAGGAHGLGATR